MGVYDIDWGLRCFSDIEGNITNKSIYAFSFLVGKHHEPQSINAKLFLPMIPIGIVAHALTLLWDNLCRNSCICRSWYNGSYTIMAKPMKTLQLHYPTIQFLIKANIGNYQLLYTTQVNSIFHARWLASWKVISQVLFTSTSVNNC